MGVRELTGIWDLGLAIVFVETHTRGLDFWVYYALFRTVVRVLVFQGWVLSVEGVDVASI